MADNTNETQIRTLIERWAQAVRDGDMDSILAHHTNDIVMFDVPPPLQVKGIEAYKEQWELFFQYSPGGEGSFDLIDLEIVAGDTAAYCHTLVRVVESKVRLTMGFRKEGGKWLIAHEHHSAPIELDEEQ
jgi:uncharacterized protein (TIGR02246 family)